MCKYFWVGNDRVCVARLHIRVQSMSSTPPKDESCHIALSPRPSQVVLGRKLEWEQWKRRELAGARFLVYWPTRQVSHGPTSMDNSGEREHSACV